MKIVILGAGQVGSTVAESLVSEANDITVVDVEPARLKRLQDRLDLRTVTGNAAHPAVLEQAGARDADLLLAVTQSDETNMVACKLAATMFNIPTKIARIRSADYLSHPEIFSPANFAVDYSICPEQILCDSIVKLLEFPEALQVLEFADGKVSLVAVRAFEGGPLVGHELQFLRSHMPKVETRVAAIFRHDSPIAPEGSTVVEAGDEVFFVAATENIRNEDIYGYIDRIGGRYTGGTAQLATTYTETVPSWGLESALHTPAARESLIQRGRLRRERFSWKRCAQETVSIYEEITRT